MSTDLYKAAGVDVDKGDELVAWLQKDNSQTQTYKHGEILDGIGGFAGMFRPNLQGIEDAVLVASTDGVGTKVLLGLEHNKLEGLGIDLVAMCINDLYTVGAQPLFFLDYFATGKLSDTQFKSILTGIKDGLRQASTFLMGGETAELPGLYAHGHFDLAGFVVGLVDGKKKLGPHLVKDSSKLYAFKSSGFHSNGYSLLRRWLDGMKPDEKTTDLVDRLLTPTKIYHEIPALLSKLEAGTVQAFAHITGGGISGNLPRVIPRDYACVIKQSAIATPTWMNEFIKWNGGTFETTEGVFNLGIGMIAVVDADRSKAFDKACQELSLSPEHIGDVRAHSGEAQVFYE